MLALYVLTVCLLGLVAARVAETARRLAIPALLASGIVTASAVYLASLVPGAFGRLNTPTVYLTFGLLCAMLLAACARLAPASGFQRQGEVTRGFELTRAEWLLLGLGLLGSAPLLEYLGARFPAALIDPDTALGWDTVSYHLPGYIEFWQNGTLWSLEGPYQSYSFAFELVGNFLSHPFFTHWGLVLANAFAVGLLVLGVVSVARRLASLLPNAGSGSWMACAVLATGIWSRIHADELGAVGNNDVFMTACLVAALGFVLEIPARADRADAGVTSLVLLTGLALGLALGTKPSALAFVPCFAAATWVVLRQRRHERDRGARAAWVGSGIVLSVSLLTGGFWLFRNLVVFGSLTPDAWAWKRTLVANLGNAAAHAVEPEGVLTGLGVLAILPGLHLVRQARRSRRPALSVALLTGFHAVACGAFFVTPHAFFLEGSSAVWSLRLGMPLFVSAALIYALAAVRLGARAPRWSSRRRAVLLSALLLACMVSLLSEWRERRSPGLPGYEEVKGLPRSNVYAWVQGQPAPSRIYSAGLRPYGLYGPSWRNTLFYDLHSTELSPIEAGKIRIAAVVVQFRPDLIVVSVDPHSYSGDPEKPPVVRWMSARRDCFEEVFSDPTVSAFRVKAAAREKLRRSIPADYELARSG